MKDEARTHGARWTTLLYWLQVGSLRLSGRVMRLIRAAIRAKRVIYPALGAIAALLIARWLNDHFVGKLLQHDAVTYFTALGALFGAVLAITFSVSTLLMQNAAQNTSAAFYRILAKDRFQPVLYIMIGLLTAGCFAAALLHTGHVDPNVTWWLGIATVVGGIFVIWSLYEIYERVYDRVNPYSSLHQITRFARAEIRKTTRRAKRVARLYCWNPRGPQVDKQSALMKAYLDLQPGGPLITIFSHLFDLHDKQIAKGEKEYARHILLAAKAILVDYLNTRASSSVLLRSSHPFVTTSDSDALIHRFMERLKTCFRRHIQSGNETQATDIVDIVGDLSISAVDIVHHPTEVNENPIHRVFTFYLGQLVTISQAGAFVEGLFRAADVYARVGLASISRDREEACVEITGQLNSIALYALKNRIHTVWDQVVRVYVILLGGIIESKRWNESILRFTIDALNRVVIEIGLTQKAHREERLGMTFINIESLHRSSIHGYARVMIQRISSQSDKRKRQQMLSFFLKFLDLVRHGLRSYSEQVRSIDNILVLHMSEYIQAMVSDLISLMSSAEWREAKNELGDAANWHIHQLAWYVAFDDVQHNDLEFGHLREAACKIGIRVSQAEEQDLAKAALSTSFSFAKYSIKRVGKDTHSQHDIMRCVTGAGYIALVCHKHGMTDVPIEFKRRVEELQTELQNAVAAVPGMNAAYALLDNTISSLDELRNLPFPLADTESMLSSVRDHVVAAVDQDDIDSFISFLSE